ncbi:MAG: amino acid ABC transporter substrate-binding protein [Oligoflexales bacterium]|nr:amino acid ABC transporter substrate-binding protein [Oligoflexales bacterium]
MKKNASFKRYFSVVIVILCACLFCRFAYGECTKKVFYAAWEEWAPYQFKTGNSLGGLDIELLRTAVETAGFKIDFKEMPWKTSLKKIESGTIDIVAGASKTPEREIFGHFSDSYRTEIMRLFVRKGLKERFAFTSVSDLVKSILEKKFRLGYIRGYYYGDEFEKAQKNNKDFDKKVIIATAEDSNFVNLKKERIDGLVTDHYVALDMIKKDRAKKLEEFMEPHSLILNEDPIYFLISKKSVDIECVKKINGVLKSMEENGTRKKIIDKYM